MYRLFYDYKNFGDKLTIIFAVKGETTMIVNQDNLTVYYLGNKIKKIDINDVSKIFKIRSKGPIYLPHKELLKIINHILKNAEIGLELEPIPSGIVVGTVKEDGIDIGNEIVDVKSCKIGDKVLLVLPDYILKDGSVNNYYKIITLKDLDINEQDEQKVLSSYKNGDDFFQGGE